MENPKQSFSIFASDRIRMYSNALTDGRSTAIEPVIFLPLQVSDEELLQAMQQCLHHSKSNLSFAEWQTYKTLDFERSMGVKTQRQMGNGAFVILEDGVYRVHPIDKKGLFGKSEEVGGEEEMLGVVRACIQLPRLP